MRAFAFTLALVASCNSNSDVQRLPIGSPCNTSGQCGTGKFFCDTGHPNGYCKADCHGDGDCPTILNNPDELSRLTRPRDVLVRSKSTT